MRLCLPFVRLLARGLLAVSLLSGVMGGFALVGLYTLSQLGNAAVAAMRAGPGWNLYLESNSQRLLAMTLALLIAATALAILTLARATLLNRRASWFDHDLSERVVAHELWRNSDLGQRDRSLAAVATLARCATGPTAIALAETPWALAALGALWLYDLDFAAVASAFGLLGLASALIGSRMTARAERFDVDTVALRAGDDIVRTAGLASDLSLDQARRLATQWETTQRTRVAAAYSCAQATARRSLALGVIRTAATLALVVTALCAGFAGGVAPDHLAIAFLIAMATVASVLRCARNAHDLGAARAAMRHLGSLRVARTSRGTARPPSMTRPDLRGPVLAAWMTAAASVAALVGVAEPGQLPVLSAAQSVFAGAIRLSASAFDNSSPERGPLAGTGTRAGNSDDGRLASDAAQSPMAIQPPLAGMSSTIRSPRT